MRAALRALEKAPAARHPTALAFARDLRGWLEARRGPAGRAPARRPGRAGAALAAGLSALLLALLLALAARGGRTDAGPTGALEQRAAGAAPLLAGAAPPPSATPATGGQAPQDTPPAGVRVAPPGPDLPPRAEEAARVGEEDATAADGAPDEDAAAGGRRLETAQATLEEWSAGPAEPAGSAALEAVLRSAEEVLGEAPAEGLAQQALLLRGRTLLALGREEPARADLERARRLAGPRSAECALALALLDWEAALWSSRLEGSGVALAAVGAAARAAREEGLPTPALELLARALEDLGLSSPGAPARLAALAASRGAPDDGLVDLLRGHHELLAERPAVALEALTRAASRRGHAAPARRALARAALYEATAALRRPAALRGRQRADPIEPGLEDALGHALEALRLAPESAASCWTLAAVCRELALLAWADGLSLPRRALPSLLRGREALLERGGGAAATALGSAEVLLETLGADLTRGAGLATLREAVGADASALRPLLGLAVACLVSCPKDGSGEQRRAAVADALEALRAAQALAPGAPDVRRLRSLAAAAAGGDGGGPR